MGTEEYETSVREERVGPEIPDPVVSRRIRAILEGGQEELDFKYAPSPENPQLELGLPIKNDYSLVRNPILESIERRPVKSQTEFDFTLITL